MSLLDEVLEAHGGLDRWQRAGSIEIRLRCTGLALRMKGTSASLRDVHAVTDTTRPHVDFEGLGVFDAEDPRPAGMARRLRWTDADLVHFSGYALWGYLTAPFHFVQDDVSVKELSGRRLRVTYPDRIPSHSRVQTFQFDEHGLLKHLDYTAEVIVGQFGLARHHILGHEVIDGLVVYTRRRAVPRYLPGPTLVGIRIDDVRIHPRQ